MALTLKQALAMFWEQIQVQFVKRENGKGLSTNDFTTEEKNKLASLENTTVDTTLTIEGAAADAKVVGEALAGKQPIGEYALKDDIVQPDWSQNDETAADYVKNRTHYVESVEEIVVLPEITLELLDGSSDEFAITTPFLAPIEVDTTYNIVYNGSKYECKAQSFTAGAQTATVLGNVGAQTGGTDTGEPFVVIVIPDELVSEVGYHAMFEVSDGAETATVSISTTKEIVKTIDPKYLANDKDKHQYLTTDENGNAKWEQKLAWKEDSVVEILPETEFTLDDSGDSGITDPIASHPVAGNVCIVTFNGVEYETVATELSENGITAIVMGNLSKAGMGPDTGEPFIIIVPSEEAVEPMGGMTFLVGVPDRELTSVTISVKENVKVCHKISQEFLSTPDWNAQEGEDGYIANRTHYAYTDLVEILPECTVTEADQSAMSTPLSKSLVEGKQYKVTYNGVEYDVTASILEMDGISLICLGNVGSMTGGADTGEPFIFAEASAEIAVEEGVYWQVQPLDGATSITIKIVFDSEVVKRIDKKYLPQYDWNASKGEDGYIENRTHYVNQTDVEIMPETTFTGISGENIVNATTSNFTAVTNCVVTWNGVDYECVIQSGANSINEDMLVAYVGNGTRLGGVKTDDPFLLAKLTPAGAAQVGGGYILYAMDGSTTATMKIMEPAGAVHQLDKKFIPSDLMDGYVPVLRTINGKYLKEDISLKASDVGAVPTTRTVNGKALSSNIIITAADVGADPAGTAQAKIDRLNIQNGVSTFSLRTAGASPENEEYSLGYYAFAEGNTTKASGHNSHAEGNNTIASGQSSHAEGSSTKASGISSHAEGTRSFAIGNYAHAEGGNITQYRITLTGEANSVDYICNSDYALVGRHVTDDSRQIIARIVAVNINDNGQKVITLDKTFSTEALVDYKASIYLGAAYGHHSHTEGANTFASSNYSHAEGSNTIASGESSHAEGETTVASGSHSHAEGCGADANGESSHAEGRYTKANGDYSHAEGERTHAFGKGSHVEGKGYYPITLTLTGEANAIIYTYSENGQYTTHIGNYIGLNNVQAKITNINETDKTITVDNTLSSEAISGVKATIYYGAVGEYSHSEGGTTLAIGEYSHAEGLGTTARGEASHAEGRGVAYGYASHAEIWGKAEGDYSHAEGYGTASGNTSHAEGEGTTASGDYSHAEGYYTTASGRYSHVEGDNTVAEGESAHAEGRQTKALSSCSHTEGQNTIAQSFASHAEGRGTITSKYGMASHVQGKFNIEPPGKYAHIVGNGESEDARSNAHTLDWDGNAWYAGDIYVGGTSQDDAAAERLVRTSDIAAPRDYIALTDQVTGKIYRLTMENGSLITTLVEGGE